MTESSQMRTWRRKYEDETVYAAARHRTSVTSAMWPSLEIRIGPEDDEQSTFLEREYWIRRSILEPKRSHVINTIECSIICLL